MNLVEGLKQRRHRQVSDTRTTAQAGDANWAGPRHNSQDHCDALGVRALHGHRHELRHQRHGVHRVVQCAGHVDGFREAAAQASLTPSLGHVPDALRHELQERKERLEPKWLRKLLRIFVTGVASKPEGLTATWFVL